jgi:D-tyrosyl-tRNA(Tyr) deacylase
MRALIQRVNRASVEVSGEIISSISSGLLVFIGVADEDVKADAEYLAAKISALRIFPDEMGKMNLSVGDINGEWLIVSQFTLHASTKKGNRPSFIRAARPEVALELYNYFVHLVQESSPHKVFTGRFGANMNITLENSGPVTIFIDSSSPE